MRQAANAPLRGLRSVRSDSTVVMSMKTTEAPNTQCGAFWSMIQPNNSGLMMPPMLKPVETMPKARPAAPAGAAARTSMSREGAITPLRKPATVIAVGPGAVVQGGASDVSAVGLVQVAAVVVAEVILQEPLVDLLDNGEQAVVVCVERELGIGVPRRGNACVPEQTPGQRLPHLRRIVVHRLEIDARHLSDVTGVVPDGYLP